MPEPIILKEDITAEEAKRFEAIYWYYYRDEGWNMINEESALGNLGGLYVKWDKDMICGYLKEHPEIKSRGDFNEMCSAGYNAAFELGLLDELFGEKTRCDFYVKEDIINYVAKHPEIKTREDLRQAKPGMFKAAWKFKMFDELFGEITNKEHTKEEILNYLNEHPEITAREKFRKANANLYEAARKKKMLQELFGDKKTTRKWYRESIIEYVQNNPDIKTQTDLYYKCQRAYIEAKKLNMLVELFGKEPRGFHYTKEYILNYLKEHPEIKRRVDLQKQHTAMYNAAKRLNILQELFGDKQTGYFNPRRNTYTKEDVIDYLKEHPEIKRRIDLQNNCRPIYNAAHRLNILQELFGDKQTGYFNPRRNTYTKEDVIDYLKEHPEIKNRSDLRNKSYAFFGAAKRLKLLDELLPIMTTK